MALAHCIIHHLERSVPGGDVSFQQREKENTPGGGAWSMFEQLKQTYQRSGLKQYGTFDRSAGDNPLPGWLKEFSEGKSAFARFSARLVERLQLAMEQHQEPFSAHIMVAIDEVMGENQWYLFWVNHVEASCIDSELEVLSARYIDTGKLHYGARLYIDEWLKQDTPKYLSMITARGNRVLTDAFSQFLGFSEGLDLVEDTSEFLQIVDNYVDTLPEEKTADIKGKIVDYCVEQDKVGEPIIFDELSSQLDQAAPERFAHFVSSQQQEPRTEIYADRRSLKRYTRYFGRDNTMSISFSSDLYGDEIVYDEATDTLTIKRIPKSLKQQLRSGAITEE